MVYLLLIGAMKSGTTLLFNYLCQHPAIVGSVPKEPEYFSRRYDRGLSWYEQQFPAHPNAVCRLDGSTGYTKYPYFPDVASHIVTAALPMKFIYVVRHPIDRLVSHLRHRVAMGRTSAAQWDHEIDKFLPVSNYDLQLRQYDFSNRANLLVIDFDDLLRDPRTTVSRCLGHIGLSLDTYKPLGIVNSGALKHLDFDHARRHRIYQTIHHDIERFGLTYQFDVEQWRYQ